MQSLFESIKETYNSLWQVKILGNSLEIVTPMVTTDDDFVSVFVTKRDDDYIVTDGGWISAGYYHRDMEDLGRAYQRLFQYYIDNYDIRQTNGHGRILYYKKVKDHFLVVNAIFELSHFISAVVSGANIQFQSDKKEVTFRRSVKDYLNTAFEKGTFRYGERLIQSSSIEFGAISNFGGHTQLLNFVTGSSAGYYRDSLCRSNMYFDYAQKFTDSLKINKTIAILDDTTPSVYNSQSVSEFIELSQARAGGNILLPWGDKTRLSEVLVA